ncbi:MAG: DUF4249 domain-containing protein, partial [Bacteroidetes bacterium]|nr:DUF4249 domain-containing protein [Bacteroidota bacterium]
MKKIILCSIASLMFLFSCTEDINLNVVGGEKKIVIEGSIENGQYAKVIVTRNSPLSQTINVITILVTDAKVYVSNGVITDTLVLSIDSFASFPLVYKGSLLVGVPQQTYYLTVIADGKTYTSITTIPASVALDSVWWQAQPPRDSLGYAWAHLSEPAGYGNAYKWFAKRATEDSRFISPYASSFDDKFIDGKSFDFAYNRGTDPNDQAVAPPEKEEDGFFKITDTVYIKFCTIDYYTAKFYTTYEAALQTN